MVLESVNQAVRDGSLRAPVAWAPLHLCRRALTRIELALTFRRFAWSVICLGILARLVPYLSDRSLWLDELYLALNITSRSLPQLIQPLDHDQGAPIGFLVLQKLSTQILGNSEYSLRLIPLLSGMLSVLLFYHVANYFIGASGASTALLLFAFSPYLVYYSSEAKQYSTDVMVSLIVYYAVARLKPGYFDITGAVVLSLAGAIAIWMAHPSVFVLLAIAFAFTMGSVVERDWLSLRFMSVSFSIWFVSLVICYMVAIRDLSNNASLLAYWSNRFMPFPPSSLADIRWLAVNFMFLFEQPVGLSSGVAAFLFLSGAILLASSEKRKCLLLVSPILLTMGASGLHLYPFGERLALFMVPSILILIALGIYHIKERLGRGSAVVGSIVVGVLMYQPVLAVWSLVSGEPGLEQYTDMRAVLRYVADQRLPGDLVYLSGPAQPGGRYYGRVYGVEDFRGTWSWDWQVLAGDLEAARGSGRVWTVVSQTGQPAGREAEEALVSLLDRLGRRVDSFHSRGAAAYLYDLTASGGTLKGRPPGEDLPAAAAGERQTAKATE